MNFKKTLRFTRVTLVYEPTCHYPQCEDYTHTINNNLGGCGEQNTLTTLTSLKIIITRNIESVCKWVENLSFCCWVLFCCLNLTFDFLDSWFGNRIHSFCLIGGIHGLYAIKKCEELVCSTIKVFLSEDVLNKVGVI